MSCVVTTPRLAALCALDAVFGQPLPDLSFRLTPSQEEGLLRARAVLARRSGVVIADRVGTGKTFVALGLIEPALRAGRSVLVTSPAALRTHWRNALSGISGPGGRVVWTSHTRLSRGELQLEAPDLVVVDEAHAFRNPLTRRYRTLARACAGARVVLLTATPVGSGYLTQGRSGYSAGNIEGGHATVPRMWTSRVWWASEGRVMLVLHGYLPNRS